MSVSLEQARRAIDAKTKPLGALGRLEDAAVRLAVLQQTLTPRVASARVCVFGADHGVADEGVSAYPRAVTGEMMRNFGRGGAAINVIARSADVEVEVIDVGVDADLKDVPGIRHESVRRGSRNFAQEPALSTSELAAAMRVGDGAARRAHAAGVTALGLGEMGIANTTSAAALLAALTGAAADVCVGRGTGVDDAGLARKVAVVTRAIDRHSQSIAASPREALACVGGLEIAAIAGAALAASELGLAVIADGFISTVAVLAALHMARHDSPERAQRLGASLFFAHRSAERGHAFALEQCGTFDGVDASPLVDLGLRLGEGTGAALAMPLLRAAASVMREMATFESAGVSAGDHASEHSA